MSMDEALVREEVKFLLDKTTAPYQTILNEQYDAVVHSDKHASATDILQAAQRSGRTVLTFDAVYLIHEKEVQQSLGVIVLRLEFEHESHEDKVEWLKQFMKFAHPDINKIQSPPITAWTARRLGDNSWKLERYELDIDEVALSGIMDPSTWPDNEWLPQWTSNELVDKQFYYFSSEGNQIPNTWPTSEDDPNIYFPNSIKIHAVDSIEKADFIVVNDDAYSTEKSYQQALYNAKRLRLPILKLSNVEFSSWFIENSYHSPQILTPTIKVQETLDKGYLTLTFDKNAIEVEDDGTDEKLKHEILLRDPIVRSFMEKHEVDQNWISTILAWSPLRIKNTRWRISDVLEIYLSNAWFFSNTASVTCMRDWDEDKFNEEYDIEFKAIKPTDAVFAALFVFYIANEEAVAKAKETTPPEGIDQIEGGKTASDRGSGGSSAGSKNNSASDLIAPSVADIQNESFTLTTFERLRMGYAFTMRGEPVHKEVFKINRQNLPVFDFEALGRKSEYDITFQSERTKSFIDNHMDIHSANPYLHLFSTDSSHGNTSGPPKEDAQEPSYWYFTRDIVKATISFKKENLIVAPDFKEAVKEAFDKTDKWIELCKVFDEYGYFWPASTHIGGKVVWSTEYSENANAFGRGFSNGVNEFIQKEVALFDGQQLADVNMDIEPTTNSQPLHPIEELAQVVIKKKINGGEESSVSYTIWSNSVNTDSTSWNIVSRKDVIPIWRLLDDELQKKVDQLIAEFNEQCLVPFNGVYQFRNLRTRCFLGWKNVYYYQMKQDEAGKIIAAVPILSAEDNNGTKWRIVPVKWDESNNYLRYGDLVYLQPITSNTEYLHLSMDLPSPVTNVDGQLSLREITSSTFVGENKQWIIERSKDEYQDIGDKSPFVQKPDVFRLSSLVRKDEGKLCLASDINTMENVAVHRRHKGVFGKMHRLQNIKNIGFANKLREILVLENGDVAKDSDGRANWMIIEVGHSEKN